MQRSRATLASVIEQLKQVERAGISPSSLEFKLADARRDLEDIEQRTKSEAEWRRLGDWHR